MSRLLLMVVFVVAACVAGSVTLGVIPLRIMDSTLATLGRDGTRVNTWIAARRATPESRVVVRPSPDLAYSLCVYDVSRTALKISVPPWQHYWSLSLYAANTDNYAVWNDREFHDTLELVLIGPHAQPPQTGLPIVRSPSDHGVAVIRRLLVDQQRDWQDVERLRKEDVCTTLN